MIVQAKLRLAAAAAASLVAFIAMEARPAAAQLLWDWGGDETVGGSGRQVVAFNPQYGTGEVIVSFGDRKLYYITQPGQAISYPIAIPREQSRWQGVTSVSMKREHPSWTPTPTMIAENPRLPRWVPGGHPMNPLGVRALYLGSSAYRIHGTDAPWTIGTAASKGCIRLFNQDVLDLYPRVTVGARVTVTYQTFTTNGTVTAGAPSANPVGTLTNALPKVTVPNLFMYGDDDPPVPSKPMRAKSKGAAPSKGAAAQRSKAAEKRAVSTRKAAVIETAASP